LEERDLRKLKGSYQTRFGSYVTNKGLALTIDSHLQLRSWTSVEELFLW